MKYSIKNTVCQLVPAILLTSVLVGCGGTTTPPAVITPTTGTVTVNVTGTSTTSTRSTTGIYLATFSSGQAVPDESYMVGAVMSFSGTLVGRSDPTTAGKFEVGNYGLIPGALNPDTCQVTTPLTNATADTSISYSGSDSNNYGGMFPIIPITLTGGDAIINITCTAALST